MWVDIDDVRAELERLVRKGEEELAEEEEQYEFLKTLHMGTLLGYTKVEIMLDELEEDYRKERNCEWIKYDSWTICPKHHDANNPYWRIPENTDKLKYCPYCGKKITIVKGE